MGFDRVCRTPVRSILYVTCLSDRHVTCGTGWGPNVQDYVGASSKKCLSVQSSYFVCYFSLLTGWKYSSSNQWLSTRYYDIWALYRFLVKFQQSDLQLTRTCTFDELNVRNYTWKVFLWHASLDQLTVLQILKIWTSSIVDYMHAR